MWPVLIPWWQWKDWGDNCAHIVKIKNKWQALGPADRYWQF